MNGKSILIIILAIILVLFLILNSARTEVNFIFFQVRTSTAILIFISAIIGFLIGVVLPYTMRSKSKSKGKSEKV
ncbi:MAG: LapA family protein [candidate division Zixibacteria bacterium]|nr:LapA family protein [candidate division Zixibacteria bacterium]NIR65421.1 LapA family protein [candidate division Zixibacteria bacterium]NIS15242.1 LapA family protein [candidate division Zixibacteria bacterium]NIS45780.1 LapA family protein [candidate division Zixibacteria bacterium]NIT51772.1 LapA family protein [candidate division Zixibacteria bacterium]